MDTAAFTCLAWALLVYGAHQLYENRHTDATGRTLAPAFRSGYPQIAQHAQDGRPHYAPQTSPALGPDAGGKA
ncbi:hypothetical protein OHA19_42800 (plasmid) [Streptomyces sp. NBC_00012]|uniref:hypothetical protein n=1 Tax=Streptomyces sp. NBC_00012 TaxID=2975621 RepID=UPI002F919F77